MKVLLLNGSPHKDGSTFKSLNEICKEFSKLNIESEIVQVGSELIRGCIDCGYCHNDTNHHCVFNDLTNEVKDKLNEADGLIVGSPVYYGSMNATLDALLTRVFYSIDKEKIQFKPATAITVARRAGTTSTYDQIVKYFTISNMVVVNGWNNVYGTEGDDVYQDKEGIQTMRNIARNFDFVMKSLALANEQLEKPQREKTIHTNYIR